MVKMLAEQLERTDDPAVVDEWGATSWRDLDERVNRLIDHLRAAGVQPDDRIALLSGNRREIEEAYLACSHAGWHCVPINWHFAAPEVAYVLADSGAAALIVASELAELAADALALEPETVPKSRLVYSDPTDGSSEGPGPLSSYEDALAAASSDEPDGQMLGGVMFYTSGTTGRPKGVRSTTWQPDTPVEVLQLMASSMDTMHIPARGRTLLCGPHYHSAQWAFSYLPFIAGSSIVMQSKFIPEQMLNLIDVHQITNVHLVPTQFVRLLRVDEARRNAFDGSSLSVVVHGAAPCAPEVKRAMIDWFGPIITEYYGATEGGVVSVITADEWLAKPGSVGTPMPIVEVKIVNELGADAAPNEEGIIHIRSLVGQDFEYLNAPEKTAEAHSESGFITMGDIGYIDDEGYLFMSDRKIDMIISGGVNIYPAEIEAALTSDPNVLDVAVIGVPDVEFGESVKAVLQLVDGVEWSGELEAELAARCARELAGYKRPRTYDVVDELPRSAAGKLLKRQIRTPYWEATGRKI